MRLLVFVYRGLIILFIFFGVAIIGGTIYGVFSHASPFNAAQKMDDLQRDISEEGQTFVGIGKIRVSTIAPNPGMVILFVSFKYFPSDKAFSEELVLRIGDFRGIIVDYIGSFSVAELQKLSEESLKIELLRRFNAILRLGQIEVLYLSDFIII